MVHSGQLRQRTSKAIFWKWALGIGVGATCAVVVVEAGRTVHPPMVTVRGLSDLRPGIEATGTASIGGTTLTTASVELPVTPPAPAVLPPEKPQAMPAVAAPIKPRAPARTKLARFETCLPDCETRDPLVAVAGSPPPLATPPEMVVLEPVVAMPPRAAEPSLTFLPPPLLESLQEPIPMPPPRQSPVDLAVDTGRALVEQAQGASGAVLNGTRRALDVAADLVF